MFCLVGLLQKGFEKSAFLMRYFVLTPTELLYYKEPSDTKPAGSIPIGETTAVTV